MSLFGQITIGTMLLAASSILHVLLMASSLPMLKKVAKFRSAQVGVFRLVLLVGVLMVSIVVSHGVQIWIWAAVWLGYGAFSELQEALYFSAVTYTTLGYGDVVLGPDIRIIATFCAVCGLLSFGVSTAILVGLITRIMPRDLVD